MSYEDDTCELMEEIQDVLYSQYNKTASKIELKFTLHGRGGLFDYIAKATVGKTKYISKDYPARNALFNILIQLRERVNGDFNKSKTIICEKVKT